KARVLAADAARQLARAKALAADKLIALAERDSAQAATDAARAQVAAAAAAVEQARAAKHQGEINLAYTTIVAPIDGVVISRNVDVGQTVAASLQAPTLFMIAEDPKKMQVDTNVAEADVGRLTPHMSASFTVDTYPRERFHGTVRQIRDAPQMVQNVVTYDAVIDVDNSDLKLKPGMTANVTFVVAERDAALVVPNAALRFRPRTDDAAKGSHHGDARDGGGEPSGRHTVWVLREGRTVVPIEIRTGITDGVLAEVLNGELRQGDLVVTDVRSGRGAGSGSRAPSGPQ